MRVQNENTGKSSWWIINPEVREKEKEKERERERERQHTSDSRSDLPDAAGSGSSTSNSPKGSLVPNSAAAAASSAFLAARRRATTMDTSEYEMKRNRARKMARAAAAQMGAPLRSTTLAAQQADMAAGAGSTSTIQAGIAGLGFGLPPTGNSPGQLATYSELSGSQASLLGYEGGAAAPTPAAGTPGERGRYLSARGSGLDVDAATQQYLAQYSAVSPLRIAQQHFSGVHTPHSEQSASHPLTPQSPLAHGSHQNLQATLMHGSPGAPVPVPVPLPVQLGYRSAYPAQSSASPTPFSDTDLEPSAYTMGAQLNSAASASYYEQLADSSTGGFAAYPVVSASGNYPLPIAEEPLQYQPSFAVDIGAGNAADFMGKLSAPQPALNPYSATSVQPSLLGHQTRGHQHHQHHQHQTRATVAAPVSSAAAPLLTSLLSPGPLIAGGRQEASRTSGGNSLCAPMTLDTKPSASQLYSEHNRSHPNLYQSPPEQQQHQQPAPQLTTQSSIPPELEAQRMRSQFAYESKPTADELASFQQQQRRLAAMQQASSPSNYLPAVSMGLNKSASTGDTKGLYPPAYGAAMQQLHSSPYPNGGGGGGGVGVGGMPGGDAELDVGEERKSSVTGVFELSSLDAVDYVDPMRMFDAQQPRFGQHQPHRI